MMGKYSQGLGELTPLKFGAEVRNCIWCLWKSTYHDKSWFL